MPWWLYLILGIAFVAFTISCWMPTKCRKCGEGYYREALMDFSPVFVSRCDNCGAYQFDARDDQPSESGEQY